MAGSRAQGDRAGRVARACSPLGAEREADGCSWACDCNPVQNGSLLARTSRIADPTGRRMKRVWKVNPRSMVCGCWLPTPTFDIEFYDESVRTSYDDIDPNRSVAAPRRNQPHERHRLQGRRVDLRQPAGRMGLEERPDRAMDLTLETFSSSISHCSTCEPFGTRNTRSLERPGLCWFRSRCCGEGVG